MYILVDVILGTTAQTLGYLSAQNRIITLSFRHLKHMHELMMHKSVMRKSI